MRKLYTALIITLIVLTGVIFMSKYTLGHLHFYGDSIGYYTYLPATFIYHNLQDIEQLPANEQLNESYYSYVNTMKAGSLQLGQQHWVNQYTYGIALMELPFFTLAHTYEVVTGKPANGYSDNYIIAIFLSGIFYTFAGLWLTYKILIRYFKPFHSFLAVSLLLMATHMFWFTFRQAGMSHLPLLFLYAALVYLTILLHENPRRKYFIMMGFVVGMITLIRPIDIICLLIPLLYGINSKAAFISKVQLLKNNVSSLLLAVLAFTIPLIPQLLYWKWLTGQYLYYSYGNQGFYWDDPKIIVGLFHFSNGWLPYAPIMIFSLIGLLLYKQFKAWAPVILALLPLYIYIIYSWFCYYYINGLGSRPMLHLYPLLAIPLAAWISYISQRGVILKTFFLLFSIFSTGIILSLSILMAEDKYRSEYANMQFYTRMAFSNKLTYKKLVEWDLAEYQPNEKKLTKIATLAAEDFNNPKNEHYVTDPLDSNRLIYLMWEGEEYSADILNIQYRKSDFQDASWVKCSGSFMYIDTAEHLSRMFVFFVKNPSGDMVTWKGCKIDNKIGMSDSSCPHTNENLTLQHSEYGRWSPVYFYTKVPDDIQEGDLISLYIWNIPKKRMFFDDFKIEIYK